MYLQILILTTVGVVLLWLGYSMLIGPFNKIQLIWLWWPRRKLRRKTGSPGDPQVCPVCSKVLKRGELVSSHAYPSLSGGRDRLMNIRGCPYCLEGRRLRRCPVCRAFLRYNEHLVTRMFERPNSRNHVHVLGCSRCKRWKKR